MLNLRKVIYVALYLWGGILLCAAALGLLAALQCWMERTRYGPGLFFADVEIFLILSLATAIVGSLSLLAGRWLSKRS